MKIDRLIGILSILLQKEKVTAPFLAEKFEVSRRTISRDIEALCRAGIPLVTTQGANGGISVMEGYRLNSTLLTSSDMQAILAGLRSLDSVSGTRQYQQLMEKLLPGASDFVSGSQSVLIDLSSWHGTELSGKIEQIRQAIEHSSCLLFSYYAPGGESKREIEPYFLVFRWSSWYVWGYCLLRKDFRLFKLHRIAGLRTGKPFEKRKVPLPDLSDDRVFPRTIPAKILVRPEFRWRLAEECGPGCFEVQPDGRLLFSSEFSDYDSILSWILSFQGAAELLEPAVLRKRLSELGRQFQKQYSDP